MPRYWLWLTLILFSLSCNRQFDENELSHAPFLQDQSSWVDSMLLEMTIDEKIGQLILYRPDFGSQNTADSLFRYAKDNYLGGVLLDGLSLTEYLLWTDSLQEMSKIPLFNASTQQLALQNQFKDLKKFPLPATISANPADSVRADLTKNLIRQYGALGINLSFSPRIKADHGNEINFDFQVFDNRQEDIIASSSKLLNQLQTEKIIAVAGDFNEYHFIENDTTGYLDSLLRPYSILVQNGLSGIYIDPAIFEIDTLNLLPGHFLQRYMKQHLKFDGLMFADWTEEAPFEELTHAGADVFVVRDQVQAKVNYIKSYVEADLFSKKDLNDRVRKVLQAKTWMGLDTIRPKIPVESAIPLMVDESDDYYIRQLYESSLTLVQNPNGMLPFKDTYKRDFRLVKIGTEDLWSFEYYFSRYAGYRNYLYKPDTSGMLKALDYHQFKRSKLIVSLDNIDLEANKDSSFIKSVNELGSKTEVVLINFGNPLNLQLFDSTLAMVQVYERNKLTESFTAQLLFGALQARGRLPLALGDRFPFKHGIDSTAIIRFKYTVPEEVGIAAYKLVGIDAIARSAISAHAIPGCQVLVAKDGKIIYSKTFGTHTYDKNQRVQQSDLYDLASITKVASTTLATMKIFEAGKLNLSHHINNYLDLEKNSPIRNITLNQLLTHKSGLQANMPIASYIMYEDTTDAYCNDYFCTENLLDYQIQVADSFYMNLKWQDTIWQDIFELQPRRRNRVRYSDVNFNLLQKMVETKSETPLDEYIYQNFYYPLNLDRITYKPLDKFKLKEIIPTANDEKWRKQLVHGYVHDESAALLGGVGGNAGLFANAEDLAVLFQMLLDGGSYGGKQYLEQKTIRKFTSKQPGINRGLGFDVKANGHPSCSPKASSATYGHTGFTGTCVWVDPETDLIFIFLSNRIYPDVNNRKLFRQGTRTRIHNLVYEALNTYPENKKDIVEPEIIQASVEK